ncbi:HvfC/BufC family peptide modification chaperone [Vibrio campbellii]|uniref:HvfC/BufC family peptide modification chaperone n=1 Tax=Vibrio campbellii TaxID=680 RepID=UPI0005EFCDB0|nr:putative DNA-binding domain-containing protein [Vibrio campbellii]
MLNPPSKMRAQTKSLTALIRTPMNQHALCRYSEFIRDNILGVVANTFPLFSSQFADEQLERMVDDFVVMHGASEPEFHHIATEFVQFLQQKAHQDSSFISADQKALLEYEWVAFNVEIDTLVAAFNSPSNPIFEENQVLQLNPTLKLVEVPFLLHQDSVTFLTDRRHPVFYGVLRNSQHHVISQKLREVDVALVQLLQQQPNLTLAQLQQMIAQQLARFSFMEWAQHFSELGLVNVRPSGEKL